MSEEGFPKPEDQVQPGEGHVPNPEEINGDEPAGETAQDLGHVSIEVATPDDIDDSKETNAESNETEAEGSQTSADSDDGLEPNTEKAWDMAIAGDEMRTKAVQNRDVARHQQAAQELREDFYKKKAVTDPSPVHFRARAKRKEELGGMLAAANEADHAVHEEDTRLRKESKTELVDEDFTDPWGADLWDEKKRAEAYDNRSQALEEWAAILHDHPVNQAYKDAHPGFEFTPDNLLQTEREAKKELERADKAEHKYQSFWRNIKAESNLGHDALKELDEAFENVDESTGERYVKADHALDEALKEMNAARQDLLLKGIVEPMRNKAALLQAVVNDVREGRASQQAE